MLHSTDVPGWADELTQHAHYAVTWQASIASVAIVVLAILIAQILRRPGRADLDDDEL